jgi:hypothetical protein
MVHDWYKLKNWYEPKSLVRKPWKRVSASAQSNCHKDKEAYYSAGSNIGNTGMSEECAARFSIEDEACNFIEQLRTRHGAQDIQLLDEDGVRLEASLPSL